MFCLHSLLGVLWWCVLYCSLKDLNLKRLKEKSEGLPWWSRGVRLHASTAGDEDLIPAQGTKTPHAAQCCKKERDLELWDSEK